MPPELVKGQGYSNTADWWTFGALIYEMFTGRPPFYSRDKKEVFKNICEVYTFLIEGSSQNVSKYVD